MIGGPGASPAQRRGWSEPTVSAEAGAMDVRAQVDRGYVARARIEIASNVVTFFLDLSAKSHHVGGARWVRSSCVDVVFAGGEPPPGWPSVELEVALARAMRDPDLLNAAGAHPAVVLQAGRPPKLGSTTGQLGAELGDALEHLALDEVRKAIVPVRWAVSARRATEEEDGRGIDLVVETRGAPLYVQVKNSFSEARAYIAKYRDAPTFARTIVLVMRDFVDPGRRIGWLRSKIRLMGPRGSSR